MAAAGLDRPAHYPWGDRFDHAPCNTVRSEIKGTTAIGSYPNGAAPSGCEDLSGNVWELTCTGAQDDNQSILVKGGSWYDFPVHARLDQSFRSRMHRHGATIGFRLIYGREERLPDSVSAELAEACITFRRQQKRKLELVESDEFEMVVDDLRSQASSGVDLEQVAREVALRDTEHAVDEFFDSVERSPVRAPAPAGGLVEWIQDCFIALREAASHRPRLLLVPLAAATLLLAWLLAAFVAGNPSPLELQRPETGTGQWNSPLRSAGGTPKTDPVTKGAPLKHLESAIQRLESRDLATTVGRGIGAPEGPGERATQDPGRAPAHPLGDRWGFAPIPEVGHRRGVRRPQGHPPTHQEAANRRSGPRFRQTDARDQRSHGHRPANRRGRGCAVHRGLSGLPRGPRRCWRASATRCQAHGSTSTERVRSTRPMASIGLRRSSIWTARGGRYSAIRAGFPAKPCSRAWLLFKALRINLPLTLGPPPAVLFPSPDSGRVPAEGTYSQTRE